jgi:hypothetical protein
MSEIYALDFPYGLACVWINVLFYGCVYNFGSSPNRVGKMHLIGFNKVKYISGIYYFNRLKNLS